MIYIQYLTQDELLDLYKETVNEVVNELRNNKKATNNDRLATYHQIGGIIKFAIKDRRFEIENYTKFLEFAMDMQDTVWL